MMRIYAVYSPLDGHIQYKAITPEGVRPSKMELGESLACILCDSDFDVSQCFIQNSQVIPKQPFDLQIDKPQIVADGSDTVTIRNVPVGTTIIWPDGQTDEVTDGEVRFAVDLPGTYTLTFDAVPYLRQEVTIEAVAAT